jgi:hypothetical protein
MLVLKGSSMEKWFCWAALGAAGLLALLFILDIFLGFPFRGLSTFIDIVGILVCAIVGYLGWDAMRDLG